MKKKIISSASILLFGTNAFADNHQLSDTHFLDLPDLNFWVILTILFFILIIFWLFKKHINFVEFQKHINEVVNERIDRRIKKDDINLINSNQKTSEVSMNITQKEINNIISNNQYISDLTDAISSIQRRIGDLEDKNTNQITSDFPKKDSINSKDEQFYMMSPIDNYFYEPYKTTEIKECIYSLNKKSKSESNFEILISGISFDDVVRNRENYLKPACDEDNIPGDRVSNITTIKRGSATLQGDKWIITSKALIRYE